MSWLEENSTIIAALSSLLLTAITAVYVYLTGRLVRESQAMRSAMFQPELAIYLHPLEGASNMILLRVENVGSGPAQGIRLSPDRAFETAHGGDLIEVGIFRKGIGYLAPRQRIEHYLVNLVGNLEHLAKEPLGISAAFENLQGKIRTQKFVLDFGEMENIAWIEPPLQGMAKSVKKIQEDFGRVATGFNKLQVLTEPAADYQRRREIHAVSARLERLTEEQRKEVAVLIEEKEKEGKSLGQSSEGT